MNRPYSDSHRHCVNGNSCVCGHREDLGKPPNWKCEFSVGERFQINGITFSISSINRRGITLRKAKI